MTNDNKARTQAEHEVINSLFYPGTRQLCTLCDDPTERCEDDSIYLADGTGPICMDCYVRLIAAAPDLLAALEGLMGIVSDSNGVAGYHRNGDIAGWAEFDEINMAIAALAKAKGE